jgi:predicted permease
MFDYAALHLDLNTRVLVYTSVVSLGTGVLFGLVPALRATRAELATDLKERTARQSSNPGSRRLRSLLVTAQVALSVVALVGAGLFVRSLRNATDFNPGFDTTHTGVILFNTGEQGYGEERGRAFQRAALERASAIPGVLSASAAMDWPFHVSLARTVLLGGGESLAEAGRRSLMGIVWPGYFRTMTIPLLQGRDFNYLDSPDRPRVAVVNQTAAAQFWPGQNPIGKRVRFHGESALVEIVGQVRNASYLDIGEEPQPMIYVSLIQYHYPTAAVHVRVQGPPGPVLQQVGRAVQALDPDLLLQVETTSGILQEALWAQRLSAGLLAAFGALALTLATIGIYGVISYSVNLRVREIGVRMALGATAGDVQMMVLREGIRLVAIGVAVGTVLALGGSRLVESLLLVTGPRDAFTFTFVPAVLTLVAVFACWLPALRATRVDPCEALRDE